MQRSYDAMNTPHRLSRLLLLFTLGCAASPEVPLEGGDQGGAASADTTGAGGNTNGGGGAGDAGAAQVCEDAPLDCADCPTLESFRDSCASAFATTCGGTMIRPVGVSPSHFYTYCYDGDGTLTGKIVEVDVPNRRTVEGSDCMAEGAPVSLCPGASSILTPEGEAIQIHWFNFFEGGYRFERLLDQLSPEQLGLAEAINVVPSSGDCREDASEISITVTAGDTQREFRANEYAGTCGRDDVTLVDFEAVSALLNTVQCLPAQGYDERSAETAPTIVPDDGCWHGLFNASGATPAWWFRIEVPAPGEYGLSLDGCGNRALLVDLFEGDAMTELASASGSGECPVLTHTFAAAGTYTLRVQMQSGTQAGDFFLAFEATSEP